MKTRQGPFFSTRLRGEDALRQGLELFVQDLALAEADILGTPD